MEEKEVEQLEEVETLEEKVEDTQPEQIVIEEEHHSKYDDVKPRTEMAEMSKEEKEEIKAEVLGIEPKPVKKEPVEKISKPSKKPNILLLLLIAVVLAVIIFLITNMR